MDDIVYIKLINGDEIFAQLVGEEDGKLLLLNSMIMETISTEGEMKFLFLSRLDQYAASHSFQLDKTQTMFITEPSEAVKNHYRTSVQYAEKVSDLRFQEGITDASKYLSGVLKKNSTKQESVKDRVLNRFDSDSNTKH